MLELKYTYDTMPKSQASPEGMQVLPGQMDNITGEIRPDIVYAVKDGTELHLRMLYPRIQKQQAAYPILVHIQGSAWFQQNMNDHVLDLYPFVRHGFIVCIVEYRPSSAAKIPAQVIDVKDAVRYLAAHAQQLQIDTNRVYLSGDSSGGHTCAMCWATWPIAGLLDSSTEPLPPIRKFIDLYGPVDMLAMTEQESAMEHTSDACPESLAMGCRALDPSAQDRVRECSVLTYVDPEVSNAPLLIMHGNKDILVPFAQSAMLFTAAKAAGKDVTFYCVDNASHGGPIFFCGAVYDRLLDFVKEQAGT